MTPFLSAVSSVLIPSDMEAVHPSTSTNGITFVLQVSKRYADSLEASFRSGIPYISGVTILLERHLRMEDPICASLGNWQHLVVMAQTHCAENIILQGPVDRLKEIVDHLVRNVWLPRRTSSKPMQVSVPLVGPNSPLASGVRRGVFSNVAEQSASVISLEQGPKEPTYSRATIEGDSDSMSVALPSIIEHLRPPPSVHDSIALDEEMGIINLTSLILTNSSKRARFARVETKPLPRRALKGAQTAAPQRVLC